MNKFSRLLLLPLLSLAIIFVGLFAFARPALASDCGGDNKADFNNAGEINCGAENYRYDPVASKYAGVPVFVQNTGNFIAIKVESGEVKAIIRSCPSGNGANDPCFTGTFDPFSSGGTTIGLESYDNATKALETSSGIGPFCSLLLTTNCYPWGGSDFDNYSGVSPRNCNNTPNGNDKPCEFTGSAPPGINTLNEALGIAAGNESTDDCGIDSPLSFILCPISRFITETFTFVLSSFTDLLQNPNLSASTDLRNAVSQFVVLANTFYILIFLFIILANFISIPALDNYTIKKTLPKLIAAIILTQFSLLICQVVLDIGNILGNTVPLIILTAFNVPCGKAVCTPADAFVFAVNPFTELGASSTTLAKFFLFQLTMFVGEIVAIIALFYIAARYFFMVLLVLFAPVAFAAWVLPNTEKFFKMWWTYMIKLSIMFLLVNLLLAMGAAFSILLRSL